MAFKLKKLVIHEECCYRKKLQPGIYDFLDADAIDDFYAHNIEISAIVGKNGCGKSSLLEIIFRMVNNLSVYISHGITDTHEEDSVFITGLYSELFYTVNGLECQLICRDQSLGLIYGDKKWAFGNQIDYFVDFDDGNNMSKGDKVTLCKNLFFTLVSNYSVQAYIDADYLNDTTCKIDVKGQLSDKPSDMPWIHYIFHKNDGYMSAINISPYRYCGKLDMFREEQLERQRMQFLLLHFHKSNKDFIQGYSLSKIVFATSYYSVFCE